MIAASRIIDAFRLGGPLVSCWNVNGGWHLNQQVQWIRDGAPYLPTIFCPTLAQRADQAKTWDEWYLVNRESLAFINDFRLPVTLRWHNWGSDFYAHAPSRAEFAESALVWRRLSDGSIDDDKLLCPFAPLLPWAREGEAIAKSFWIQRLAEVLPGAPRLFWLENNEAPLAEVGFYTDALKTKDRWGLRLRAWKPALASLSIRAAEFAAVNDASECEPAIKDGFVKQRQAMTSAMKSHAPQQWSGKIYFGGYGGLGGLITAGLGDQQTFSYRRPQNDWERYPFAPEAYEFDVNSARCYDSGGGGPQNWHDWVRSPAVLEHNLAPLHRKQESDRSPLWHLDRSFWIQPSRCVKAETEGHGGYVLPARLKGFARACLWATRAEKTATVLRWFADSNETLEEPWFRGDNFVEELQHITRGDFYQQCADAVAEVWADPKLLRFWREGEAVLNPDPPLCNWELPPDVIDDRSRVLYTDADPPRFAAENGRRVDLWREAAGKLPLNVFCQAWRIGESYLIYAWSPRGTRRNVTVNVPGLGEVGLLAVGPTGVWHFAGKPLREESALEALLQLAVSWMNEGGGDSRLLEAKSLVSRALLLVTAWEDGK